MSEIKKYYESMNDQSLYELAVYESKDLTPEATEALLDVISARKFDIKIIENVEKQRKSYSQDELLLLVDSFSKIKCGICNKENGINAIRLNIIKGVVVLTFKETKTVLGCKCCLEKEKINANRENLLKGWWSYTGIIRTPIAIISNNIRYEKLEKDFEKPSEEFIEYIKNNIGEVLNLTSSN